MKPQLTIAFLLCVGLSLFGQTGVEYKVKVLPDNNTYQVMLRSTADDPLNTNMVLAGAQVTLRVPTGGFSVGPITNVSGTWSASPPYIAPSENPAYDYFFFTLDAPTTAITIEEDLEVVLFSFTNAGSCTGPMELYDNDEDPIQFPNSLNVIFTNTMTVVGFGNTNAYLGNYNAISADCGVSFTCEDGQSTIDVSDLIIINPSQCGSADGSIEIQATGTGPFSALPFQYSINGFNNATWQTGNPKFTGLASGEIYEVYVRFLGGICLYHIGDFELQGPLAAVIQNIDLNDPTCGMSDGSITITAIPNNGGQLQYGIGLPAVYQSSPTFTGLAAGLYPLWVKDIINNCSSQIGSYLLEDCPNTPCSTLDLENLGNGRYQVNLTPGESLNAPDNVTEELSITIKVPTGGFEFANLTSQITNVGFVEGTTVVAPAEEPGFDYITIDLDSINTQDIPYVANNKINLFTFENEGTCEGDSIYLVQSDDAYLAAGGDVDHSIMVSGSMLNDCIGDAAMACEFVPSNCSITYEIDKPSPGVFRISLIPNTTLSGPLATTTNFQVTIKAPTGGFEQADITSLVSGVNFSHAGTAVAPAEDPAHDYISFSMVNASTTSIAYAANQPTPLFTFTNVGPCVAGNVFLMDNDSDPFFGNPNVNVGQTITILGIGANIPVCLSSQASVECEGDPCSSLVAGFTAPLACENSEITFSNTTTSNETISSWNWEFGDGSSPSDLESPSHTYSSSGNFEVSLTVTTESGCTATFTESVTVFSTPSTPAVTSYSDCGSGVQLSVPDADVILWTPSDGLDDNTIANPFAHPMATTVYTVTLTSADGCSTTAEVTVVLDQKPVWKDAAPTDVTDCGLQDGTILATATGLGVVEFSLDNVNWTTDSLFTGLAAGDYTLFARNAGGNCPIAYNFNPITINGPDAPSIDDVNITQPTGCNDNGIISVVASGGNGPLQYRLVGVTSTQDSNEFTDLAKGDYTIEVTNADGSCAQTTDVTLVSTGAEPIVTSVVADSDVCENTPTSVEVTIDQDIQNVDIAGGVFSNMTINGPTVSFDAEPALGANSYNLKITSTNGCLVSQDVAITGTAAPTVSFSTSPTLCTGGEITLNYTGSAGASATYDWTLDGGQLVFDGDQTIISSWDTPGDKNVSLTVSENGCQSTANSTLSITAFDPGASLSTADPSCGSTDGSILLSLTGPGNYAFNWSGPGISDNSAQNQSDLPGGTYIVTVSDVDSNCETELSTVLSIPTGISIMTSSTDATDCIGNAADGAVSVQVAGGNAGFTYELFNVSDPNNALETISNSGQNDYTFEDLESGAYNVVVTDANGCTDEATVAVQAINGGVNTIFSSENANCLGQNGSVSIEITSGQAPYTYDYFLNNLPVQIDATVNGTTLNITGIGTGTGVVIISDADGCIDPVSFIIEEDEPDFLNDITVSVSEPSCDANNGTIELLGLPANSIVGWNSNPLAGNPYQNAQAGQHTATVIDANGCQGEVVVQLSATDGPEVEILSSADATCGNNDGSITFQVNGGNAFSYQVIGTGVISGQASPDQPIQVNGLVADNWIIEITDLVNADCSTFQYVTIDGGIDIGDIQSVVTLPSDCGVEDASISISLENTNQYAISTTKGTAPAQFISDVLISDLYDGTVSITLEDLMTGCETALEFDLGEQLIPEIDSADIQIVHSECPGEPGQIMSLSGIEYQVYNHSNGQMVLTPWVNAFKGDYTIYLVDGLCMDSMLVNVDGPDDFQVTTTSVDEECGGENGSLLLEVTGGNGGYTFVWPNNASSTNFAENLSSGSYDVTITDSNGCSFIESTFVDGTTSFDCNPCEYIFTNDTIFVALLGATNKICLPTDLSISEFSQLFLNLNGDDFNSNIDECDEKATFYSYSSLMSFVPPPYRLEEWQNPVENLSGLSFNTIDELVNRMNEADPTGNWTNDTDQLAIIGGDPAFQYGSMNITHIASNSTLNLEPNSSIVFNPSITVDDNRTHILIAEDPMNPGCSDTLYINLLADVVPQIDTIYVEVGIGQTWTDCLDASELNGTLEFLSNECTSLTNNAQLTATGTECIEIEGLEEGDDQFCLVLCDDFGWCDTTIVLVNVYDPVNVLEIYTAFSPNGDGVNDFFKIKNIENYTDNNLVVFNRWGNKVYERKAYTNANPWTGIYKNTALPDGSYFYILDVNIDGEDKTFTGYVHIRR